MIRFYNFEQRSPKWYAMREGRWTGSTAIDLLSDKPTPPESSGDYDNRHMQRGRILEPLAAEAYEIKYKTRVQHYGLITNSQYPHAAYSPDGIDANDQTLLEIKCLGLEKHNAIIDEILPVPTQYMAQIQFGLFISELSAARLILYNPDSDVPLHVMDIQPDPEIQAYIKKQLDKRRPAVSTSLRNAQRRYRENHRAEIRKRRHEYYMRTKQKM